MDIVERLRELDEKGYQPLTGAIGEDAATEIMRLRSALGWLVIRRTDGTMRLNQDPMALVMAGKLMKAPNIPAKGRAESASSD